MAERLSHAKYMGNVGTFVSENGTKNEATMEFAKENSEPLMS